jgi:hypothetical protein
LEISENRQLQSSSILVTLDRWYSARQIKAFASLLVRTVHVSRGIISAPAEPPFGFAEADVWAIKIVDHLDTWATGRSAAPSWR